jgi:hypothetical protein
LLTYKVQSSIFFLSSNFVFSNDTFLIMFYFIFYLDICFINQNKIRVSQAWKAFWALKFILLDKSLNRKIRLDALDTCIMPVLTYASQTWSLTTNNIEVCQRKMVRKILGVSTRDIISNTKLQNGPCRRVPHNKLRDPNGNGQDMSQGFTAPDGDR